MSNPAEVVQGFFGAVLEGNLDAALNLIADDCTWTYGGPSSIPFAGEYQGPAGVGEYLQAFGGSMEIVSFEPSFLVADDTVIIQAREVNRCRANGKEIEMDLVQVVKVSDGKIVSFQEYADTALVAALFE